MAIKSGQIIHDAEGFVIDRIQSGGVSSFNIPEEKVYELGNYKSVATVRDIPDLSFDVESYDMSTEIEALLIGVDPTTTVDGDEFDLAEALPLNVISPFKTSGAFEAIRGIALPNLTLESAAYRFGVRANASQTFTLRGDTMIYTPGTPWQERFPLVNNTLTYNFSNGPALVYREQGDVLYAYSVCVKNVTTNAYRRLFFGTDYTNTANGVTLLRDWYDEGYTHLHVVYASSVSRTYPQSVHPLAGVKPAAIRGKDIDVYVSDGAATPTMVRWAGVQSVEVNRRVNLDNDEEMGNYHLVGSDYDVADVTGSITIKPLDTTDLFDKLAQITAVPVDEAIGAYSSVPLPVEIRVHHPDTGDRLKTFYIPDARFTLPAIQGRVQTKVTVPFNFSSDTGDLKIYQGERP